jgi:hypothetical protein
VAEGNAAGSVSVAPGVRVRSRGHGCWRYALVQAAGMREAVRATGVALAERLLVTRWLCNGRGAATALTPTQPHYLLPAAAPQVRVPKRRLDYQAPAPASAGPAASADAALVAAGFTSPPPPPPAALATPFGAAHPGGYPAWPPGVPAAFPCGLPPPLLDLSSPAGGSASTSSGARGGGRPAKSLKRVHSLPADLDKLDTVRPAAGLGSELAQGQGAGGGRAGGGRSSGHSRKPSPSRAPLQ